MAEPTHVPGMDPPQEPSAVATDPDRVMSFNEMRAFLMIGERLAWSLCNRGELPGFRVGRLWRFRRSALVAWVAIQERRARR